MSGVCCNMLHLMCHMLQINIESNVVTSLVLVIIFYSWTFVSQLELKLSVLENVQDDPSKCFHWCYLHHIGIVLFSPRTPNTGTKVHPSKQVCQSVLKVQGWPVPKDGAYSPPQPPLNKLGCRTRECPSPLSPLPSPLSPLPSPLFPLPSPLSPLPSPLPYSMRETSTVY